MQPMREIVEILHAHPLLGHVDQSTLEALLSEMERIEIPEGETLFEKGDPSEGYYIIESGTILIHNGSRAANRLKVGQGFGEMALFHNGQHLTSATSDSGATLIRISRSAFLRLIESQPSIIDNVYEAMQPYIRRSLLTNALRRVLGEVDHHVLEAIEADIVWESYAPGDRILEQGSPGSDMLVVVIGRVRVTHTDGERERVLGEVGSGGIVGELSLISQSPRSASVTAVRETRVARINQAVFETLMRTHPAFVQQLMKIIVERQHRNFDRAYTERPTTLNLSLIGTQPGIDLRGFAESLLPYLQRHGSVIVIDQQRFEELYSVPNVIQHLEAYPSSMAMQLWLDELEQRYDYVIYLSDDQWSPWARLIVQAADRVLLVGEAARGPQPGPMERAVYDHLGQQRYELIILHEPDTERPSGTAAWLDARSVYRHHHIRKQDGAHFARLARLLTGNGIGFVLGGGGARGYTHIGVIKAIMETQVPIDAIGAVSMGAVVGGGLLTYMDYQSILEHTARLGSRKAILDFTFPVSALMRSKKIVSIVNTIYGDFQIEDGWLPFYCVSTNLSEARLNVHRRGRLADAVRASISIPGVFSPVVRDGSLTIDGGVMNNYPVDVMRHFLEGGVIIGTLVASAGSGSRYEIEDYVDGWQTFLSGLIPGKKRKRVPSILKTILGATAVNSYQQLGEFRRRTDFLLQTDTSAYGMLDFDQHMALVERGYEAHQASIATWAKANTTLIEQPPMWPPVG